MRTVMERMLEAMNAHDLDAFVDFFDANYRSEQPLHPERAFQGSDQVRVNWRKLFAAIPDFKAELRTVAQTGNGVELGEWSWGGTQSDGSAFAMKGMVVQGTREGKVLWARLYMGPLRKPVEGQSSEPTRPPN